MDAFVNLGDLIDDIDTELQKASKDMEKDLNKSLFDDGSEVMNSVPNEDTLEKGAIFNEFQWGGGRDALNFTKTGKEIKEHLPKLVEKLTAVKGNLEAKIEKCREAAGCEPDQENYYGNSQSREAVTRECGEIPKIFNWELCYPKYDELSRTTPAPTEQHVACSKHNDLVRMWCDVCEDICACKTIQNNVEDNKKYNFTINQLFMLGM